MTKPKPKIKRLDKSPGLNKDGSESDTGAVDNTNTATTSRGPPSAWFTSEILAMMHGFGDCQRPLMECAVIIEEVVHQQLAVLLHQASEIAKIRSDKPRYTDVQDFIFLLRKDKSKLRRLIKYMSLKDAKTAFTSGAVDEEEGTGVEPAAADSAKTAKNYRRRKCYEFISSIDQTGELIALFDDDNIDEIKYERALRAELQTRPMDQQQYLDFCEARQASFSPRFRGTQRFKDWVLSGSNCDPKPSVLAVEVLNYMAYETVAQIVELALVARRDSQRCVDDPMMNAMPTICTNYEPSVCNTQTTTTPNRSPSRAPSPTFSPGGMNMNGPTTSTDTIPGVSDCSSLAASVATAKAKAVKRKKSISTSSRDMFAHEAIQPKHIREALRRYGRQMGPHADFSKQPLQQVKQKVFCA